ncbi:unnamed protein product [Trifolium pratense]|uniref:Uncharacterized protein n=1 Tax=Trifolium pratense TaxID=57577 RepID=A0ACB0J0V7_TRIPR|nr:unnamed protein product [Trifolium pratense]
MREFMFATILSYKLCLVLIVLWCRLYFRFVRHILGFCFLVLLYDIMVVTFKILKIQFHTTFNLFVG